MFGSNYISQRNSSIHSQSCYEGSYHPSLFESFNKPQCNPYQLSNPNPTNQQTNLISQNPIIFTQYNNMSNNNKGGVRKPSQQSFTSSNFINYKQFENIFIEKIKQFPEQVNEFLTKKEENNNLNSLIDSVNNSSLIATQSINKINETYCNKLSNSNFCVPKLFEICTKINEILNTIDIELLKQFSLLTSFHGYDESIQNDEKVNLSKIQNVVNECNELLRENIIKIDNNSMNFNNEINANCEQFRIILGQEMDKLCQNLNELIKYKIENNNNYTKYLQITDNIIKTINSLKNKFIFTNYSNINENSNETNDKTIIKKENNDYHIENNANEKNNDDLNMNKTNVITMDENTKTQNIMATMKIINEMHKRNKKKKNKNFK